VIPVLVQLNECATTHILFLADSPLTVESLRLTYSLAPSIRIGNPIEKAEFGDLLEQGSELSHFLNFPPMREWLRFSDYSGGILIELNPTKVTRMGKQTEAEKRIIKGNVKEKRVGNYTFTATVEKTYEEEPKEEKPPAFDGQALLLKLSYAQDEADRTGEPVNVSDDYGYVGTCFPKRS